MGIDQLTTAHVLVSLVALATGFIVLGGWLSGAWLARTNTVFLVTTVATSVTAFAFPITRWLPSHTVAVVSLAVLAVAIYALQAGGRKGIWRSVYIAAALVALYLNVFVLIVQTFVKNPSLAALAPKQTEPVFVVTHILTLAAFLAVGVVAVRNRSAETASTA